MSEDKVNTNITPNPGEKKGAFIDRAFYAKMKPSLAEAVWKINAPTRGATGTTANFYELLEKGQLSQEGFRKWLETVATENDKKHQSLFKGIGNLTNRVWAKGTNASPIDLKTEKLD